MCLRPPSSLRRKTSTIWDEGSALQTASKVVALFASRQSRRFGREDTTSFSEAPEGSSWWPVSLGTPSSVGAQNDLRYAVFPRRLVIKDGEHIDIYDTGNHRISGVAQAQSADQTLTFTSQDGLVRVKDLPKVAQ